MKNILLLALFSFCAHEANCMQAQPSTLLQELKKSFDATEKDLSGNDLNTLDEKTRKEVQERLSIMKRSIERLVLMLNDPNGIMEISEK